MLSLPIKVVEDGYKYQEPSIKTIREEMSRFASLFTDYMQELKKYLKDYYVVEYAEFDENALKDVVVRTDKRKEHAKIFHRIDDSSELRYMAIACYWIIKLHPFIAGIRPLSGKDPSEYPVDYQDVHGSNINEGFAIYLFIMTIKLIMRQQEKEFDFNNEYLHELKYTLRYRDVDKNALIMLFEPIMNLDKTVEN